MATGGSEIVNPRTGQRIHFVKTARDTGGALLELDCSSPPHLPREPEHFHPLQESSMAVRSGALRVRLDGQERVVGPGERVVIPAGVLHQFWVEGDEEAHYVQEFRPALKFEAFLETWFRLAQDDKLDHKGLPNPLMLAVMGRHFRDEMQVVSPPPWLQRILYAVLAPIASAVGYRPELIMPVEAGNKR